MEHKFRILLVEDEVLTAMTFELELEDAGYEVCKHVTTGEAAILVAKQESPDLVLMDIHLAGRIDGVEAAEQIHTFLKSPIIFVTGYQDSMLLERVKKNPSNGLSYQTSKHL